MAEPCWPPPETGEAGDGFLEQVAGMPPLTAIRPTTHYVPVSKENHYLTDPDAFQRGGLTLDVGRSRGQTYITFALSAPEGTLRSSDGEPLHLDHTDREIISAIASLREAARRQTGEPVVSAYNILVEMGADRPEPSRCSEIDRRIRNMMSVGTYIDYTAEAIQRGLVNPDTGMPVSGTRGSFIIRGNLIPATAFEATDVAGNTTVRYQLTDDPPTYKHASAVEQVVRHPSWLLHLPPLREDGTEVSRPGTDRRNGIKSYILERVYALKNRKSTISGTIRYDTLCEKVDVAPGNRHAKKSVVDYAEGYLRALQREGIITSFSPHAEGRSHAKVAVEVFVKEE